MASTPPPSSSAPPVLAFWKVAFSRIAKFDAYFQSEFDALCQAVDGGLLDAGLIASHGHELLTVALLSSRNMESAYKEGDAFVSLRSDLAKDAKVNLNERVVALLLANGANPWSADLEAQLDGTLHTRPGQTYPPIVFALKSSPLPRSAILSFLDHPACPDVHELSHWRVDGGKTLMDLAVESGDHVVVKRFIDLGMDPNYMGLDGNPVLFRASNAKVVAALIDAGADATIKNALGQGAQEYWALNSMATAGEMSACLPNQPKASREHPALSLGVLLDRLSSCTKSEVKQLLSMVSPLDKAQWDVGGRMMGVSDAVVAICAFADPVPMESALFNLTLKKNRPEGSSADKMSCLLHDIWGSDFYWEKVKEIKGKCLFPNRKMNTRQSYLTTGQMVEDYKALLDAGLVPARCLPEYAPGCSQQASLWRSLFSSQVGRTDGEGESLPSIAPILEGLVAACGCQWRRIPTGVADDIFAKLPNRIDPQQMDEQTWKLWTAMGARSGSLGREDGYRLWVDSLDGRGKDWMSDTRVKECFSLRAMSDPRIGSILDEFILQQDVPADLPSRPSRRM